MEANSFLPPNARARTADYVKLLSIMKLDEYELVLPRFRAYPSVAPFSAWDPEKPTQSLAWYDAYNHVKHDAESKLNEAKLRHAVDAVAAVFVLLVAQFGLAELRDHIGAQTFLLESFPRWLPDEWYYQPLPHEPWVAVPFPF